MTGAASLAAFEVRDLSVVFGDGARALLALDNVTLSVAKGEVLALVGESGCGKSVTMMAVMGLLPRRGVRVTADRIKLGETDLRTLRPAELRAVRGRRVGMVFQDPMTSLNPVHTIGFQIVEVLRHHLAMTRQQARARAVELLDLVRIPDPRRRLDSYPHELSGGMRQRVMIAAALACNPELLIADEPTTALDVTVQAQIVELLDELRRNLGMSVILITHDLGVVAKVADRVAVMYAGRIVEEARVEALLRRPAHGYTAGLLRSLPAEGTAPQQKLSEIPGNVPRLSSRIDACTFAPRCSFATARCTESRPGQEQAGAGHAVACFHHADVSAAMSGNPIVRAWR